MSETKQQEATTDVTSETEAVATPVSTDAPAVPATDTPVETASNDAPTGRGRRGSGSADKRNQRRPRRGGRPERVRPEFDQKIISIRRVTRVMAGGRRFSFSVAIVIGDKRGKVGVGIGKAGDTQLAIEKAVRDAKRNMIVVPMNKEGHILHDAHIKYASSEVMIMPAPGRGIVAGSSVRTVLEHAGVKDVTAKIFSRSKNKLNNARAAIEALKQIKKN
ncbi:MAG: 30S ribosomal protein S5 [Candidatus Paceibacterota bacterium]